MNTKYTFLLPAYKSDFLEVALRSIKSQTLKDFKVLVSDDCSPHDLKSIYNKVCGDDARFSYRRNEKNMGSKSLVSHWNLLVDICDTEYFIMASDDDVYAPTFLEEVDKLASKYPEVDLIRARVKRFDGKQILEEDSVRKEYESQIEFLFNSCSVVQIPCIGNYVFRKEALFKNGFYELPLAWGSDEITTNEASINGVAITEKIEFSFRWSGMNISTIENDSTLRQKLEARKKMCLYYRNFFAAISSDGSYWQNKMLTYATNVFIQKTYNSIFHYFQVLSFCELLNLLSFLKANNFIQGNKKNLFIIKYWMKKKYLERK